MTHKKEHLSSTHCVPSIFGWWSWQQPEWQLLLLVPFYSEAEYEQEISRKYLTGPQTCEDGLTSLVLRAMQFQDTMRNRKLAKTGGLNGISVGEVRWDNAFLLTLGAPVIRQAFQRTTQRFTCALFSFDPKLLLWEVSSGRFPHILRRNMCKDFYHVVDPSSN